MQTSRSYSLSEQVDQEASGIPDELVYFNEDLLLNISDYMETPVIPQEEQTIEDRGIQKLLMNLCAN